jgi:hypothetical protein
MESQNVHLPDDRHVPVAQLATCIAEALHPIPDRDFWRFGMLEKRWQTSPGNWQCEPLSPEDWGKLDALWLGAKLAKLNQSLVSGGDFSPDHFEPYKQALASGAWRENWQPAPEFYSDRQDAIASQRKAKDEHLKALMARVHSGGLMTFTDSGAPEAGGLPAGGGMCRIRRVDAIAYLELCGLEPKMPAAEQTMPDDSGTEPAEAALKKAKLIEQFKPQWPSIENDLDEASRNGLKVQAYAGKHGQWSPSNALAWAQANDKITGGAGCLAQAWQGRSATHKIAR